MKTKALIIGAPPLPFEGPPVSLTDGEEWRVVPNENYRERVVVVVKRNGNTTRHPLSSKELIISGEEAYAEVLESISEGSFNHISVNLERMS